MLSIPPVLKNICFERVQMSMAHLQKYDQLEHAMGKAGEIFTKNELINRRNFVKGLLGGCFMLMTGCSHEDVLGSFVSNLVDDKESVVPGVQYGTGEDGDITVTGMSVSIVDIYENDDCTGVITKNGENKGLNCGSGTYTKTRGLHCGNFTVNTGASVTAVPFDGDLEKTGNVVIRCTGELTVRGKINVTGKGGAGGGGSYATECESAYHCCAGGNGVRFGGDGRIAIKCQRISGTTTQAYYNIEKGAYSS